MLIWELRNLFLDTAKLKFGHPILHQGNFLIFLNFFLNFLFE